MKSGFVLIVCWPGSMRSRSRSLSRSATPYRAVATELTPLSAPVQGAVALSVTGTLVKVGGFPALLWYSQTRLVPDVAVATISTAPSRLKSAAIISLEVDSVGRTEVFAPKVAGGAACWRSRTWLRVFQVVVATPASITGEV